MVDTPVQLPPLYTPRISWMSWTFFFLMVSGSFVLRAVALPVDQIPLQFNWDGHPTRWEDKNWLTLGFPTWYALLTAGPLLWIAQRLIPPAAAWIQPPTPWEGFGNHLSHAIAASLLQLTAAYMAFVGMAVQMGINHVALSSVEVGNRYLFNNSWMVAGLLVYCAYAGWLLLLFNREAKRGQYGDIAELGGVELPPANSPQRRRPLPPTAAGKSAKPKTPQPVE